jgi:hypothetical protein
MKNDCIDRYNESHALGLNSLQMKTKFANACYVFVLPSFQTKSLN